MLVEVVELLFWPEVDEDGDEVEDGPSNGRIIIQLNYVNSSYQNVN